MTALTNLVDWPTTRLDDATIIGSRLGVIPEVERVYVASRGEVLFVWTVTSDFQRSVRNRIYAIEKELFKAFPNDEFDFNVVEAGEDTYPEDISDAIVVYQKGR
jgi:hypothetical protein